VAAEPVRAGIHIDAPPERVFAYFTDAGALTAWMAERATLEPQPGGAFSAEVRGVQVRGRYLAVEPPHRVVFSWGHEGSDVLPPGASTVEVRLTAARGGTNVVIEHRDLPDMHAAGHGRGWRMFLARLAEVSARPPRSTAAADRG
jgi:uncharacterized protein YndB with AHSA1/START domain